MFLCEDILVMKEYLSVSDTPGLTLQVFIMTKIYQLLFYEEGFKMKPYIDTEGYPTVGFGIRLGPQGAEITNYTFSLPKSVGELWMQTIIDTLKKEMKQVPIISNALSKCNSPREDVICSMGYQMGVVGLSAFRNMLMMIAEENFTGASQAMLKSLWHQQTPERARRHAEVMRTGTYDCYRGLL